MSATKSCTDEEIEKFLAICDDEYESGEDEEMECDVEIEHNENLEEASSLEDWSQTDEGNVPLNSLKVNSNIISCNKIILG